jgi:adenylate kinase
VRLLLIGPPGSGKGTQAVRLAQHFRLTHISSGDLLRQHVRENTAIGRIVADVLARGDLVPDGLVMDVLRKPVAAAAQAGGYVLDGFPRTVAQAEAAYLVARELDASVQVALSLEVPREELITRLLARARESGRADDTPEVIQHRQQLFDDLTVALLDYYDKREVLVRVSGVGPVEDVTAAAISKLEGVRGLIRRT